MKDIQKNLCKLFCFLYDFSNIQKCSFKECPFTWVVPLTAILPRWNDYVELNNIRWNSFDISIIPCKNVLVLPKQCYDVNNKPFLWCYIQLNRLKVVSSSQIEESYLEILRYCPACNSWILMCVGVLSIQICPLECGKLNTRSSIPNSAPKTATLKIFGSDSVMVPFINKYGSTTKKYFFLFVYDTFHQIGTQQNLKTFGVVIQMFGHGYGNTKSCNFIC